MSFLAGDYLRGEGLGMGVGTPAYLPQQPQVGPIPMRPTPVAFTPAPAVTAAPTFTPMSPPTSQVVQPYGPFNPPATPAPTFAQVFGTGATSPAYIMPSGVPDAPAAPAIRPWVVPAAVGVGLLALILALRR